MCLARFVCRTSSMPSRSCFRTPVLDWVNFGTRGYNRLYMGLPRSPRPSSFLGLRSPSISDLYWRRHQAKSSVSCQYIARYGAPFVMHYACYHHIILLLWTIFDFEYYCFGSSRGDVMHIEAWSCHSFWTAKTHTTARHPSFRFSRHRTKLYHTLAWFLLLRFLNIFDSSMQPVASGASHQRASRQTDAGGILRLMFGLVRLYWGPFEKVTDYQTCRMMHESHVSDLRGLVIMMITSDVIGPYRNDDHPHYCRYILLLLYHKSIFYDLFMTPSRSLLLVTLVMTAPSLPQHPPAARPCSTSTVEAMKAHCWECGLVAPGLSEFKGRHQVFPGVPKVFCKEALLFSHNPGGTQLGHNREPTFLPRGVSSEDFEALLFRLLSPASVGQTGACWKWVVHPLLNHLTWARMANSWPTFWYLSTTILANHGDTIFVPPCTSTFLDAPLLLNICATFTELYPVHWKHMRVLGPKDSSDFSMWRWDWCSGCIHGTWRPSWCMKWWFNSSLLMGVQSTLITFMLLPRSTNFRCFQKVLKILWTAYQHHSIKFIK